ncbi:MAG: LacI family DNA-binding transcriptional regulator [Lentisphaeria bacterium]
MATLKQIAKAAGVSPATVSYVLNNQPDVALDTRQRVLQVVRETNFVRRRYVRRHTAAAPATTQSLAFVSCLPFDPWGESYWGQLLSGCLAEAHDADAVLQVARIDSEAGEGTVLPVAVRERVANGLIVTGFPSAALMAGLAEYDLPIVCLDTKMATPGFHHVRPDNSGGTLKALEHLHALGHERIGMITGDMSFACDAERLGAYYSGMTQLGLPWSENWVVRQPQMNEAGGRAGMTELLRRRTGVTAVFCLGDWIARGAVAAAQQAGLSVPGDLSIMGFDNQPWSAQTAPALSTVDVNLVELGRLAVRRLLDQVANPRLRTPQRLTLEAALVARASTGPARVSTPAPKTKAKPKR